MKAQKKLFVSLVMMIMTTGTFAQTTSAMWRVYHKGLNRSYYIFEKECVDSIVYTDTNYDVYVSSTKGINDEGRWLMRVEGSGEMSIASTKIGVVAADVKDDQVEALFKEGKLTDLHEAPVDITNSQNTYDFVVEDGSWKPVVFGFDANGEYRSYFVGNPQTFTSNFKEEINAKLMLYYSSDSYTGWGYGSIMHLRDILGEDMSVNSNYDHYAVWARNKALNAELFRTSFVTSFFQSAISELNTLISTIVKRQQQVDVGTDLGYVIALRAMLYLDAARMFEFLENDKVSSVNEAGNDVTGLTFPIVEEAWIYPYPTNVKRATRDEMATYLTAQLDAAEGLLEEANISDKLQASLAVVHGLKARLYMWLGDYDQAQMYAEKAIQQGGYTPLTRDEWLSTTVGFNDRNVSSWMWAMKQTTEPSPMRDFSTFYQYEISLWQTVANWASWCCSEYTGGYTGYGAYPAMGRSIYDRMSDTDFRKLSFKAPAGSTLAGQEPHLSDNIYNKLPNYASMKFRPGQGNTSDATIACAVDIPLMRIEEMHFIRIEALAKKGQFEAAKSTMESFMQQYRDANYTCSATTKEELIDEIFLQKRIELWGEGLNYFDYKRLNKPVTRGYEGTNFASDRQFNTTTRPAWMNFVFHNGAYSNFWLDEEGKTQSTDPLADWNNPSPVDCYTSESY